MVRLTTEPLDVAAAHEDVRHDESGGIGLFTGVVRDHHAGDSVDHLVYEAWHDRAEAAMREVADRVAATFPGVRALHVSHRHGRLDVGDVAVICAASAPHRHEAMDAARALIDQVKEQVPIWKQETLSDGAVRWPASGDGTP